MVYLGNIVKEHSLLNDGMQLILHFKSGNIVTIRSFDKLEKVSGDLKLSRYFKGNFDKKPQWICDVIIDCAEVEYIVKTKED